MMIRIGLKCKVCDKTKDEHRGVVHEFQGEVERLVEAAPAARKGPGDPVLRMLLIEKGLVTPDELEATERKLKIIGGTGAGYRQDNGPRRKVRDTPQA